MSLLYYDPIEFNTPDTGFHNDGLWIRPGIIQHIDSATGLLDIEWLDHPGMRQGVSITQPQQGMFQMPTVGAVVLIGFDQGFGAQILRYLPAGYAEQVKDKTLYPMLPGEVILMSFQDSKEIMPEKQFAVTRPTGTRFFMNNVGDIQMATALGEWWHMDNLNSEILQNSMNYTVSTEAGVLQFGLVRRLPESAKDSEQIPSIISTTGVKLKDMPLASTPEGLTEFRLRLLDKADGQEASLADPATFTPEVNDPFIELTLGVKVDNDGSIVKTTPTQAKTSGDAQEVIIQLKTKADQGFEFSVDREGNVTLLAKGNMKVKIDGDTDLSVMGDANIDVTGDLIVDAKKIQLAGDSSVMLSNFVDKFNTHTHPTNTGVTTAPTVLVTKSSVISKIVKVQ